jgi:hypothetical protein
MADILDPLGGVFDPARLTARGALIAGIIGDDDKAFLGQPLAVNRAGGLLLAAAERMDADDGRVLLLGIEIRAVSGSARQCPRPCPCCGT